MSCYSQGFRANVAFSVIGNCDLSSSVRGAKREAGAVFAELIVGTARWAVADTLSSGNKNPGRVRPGFLFAAVNKP